MRTQNREAQFKEAAQEILDLVAAARSVWKNAEITHEGLMGGISQKLDEMRGIQIVYENLYEDVGEEQTDLIAKIENILDIDLEPPMPELEAPDLEDLEIIAHQCLVTELPQ